MVHRSSAVKMVLTYSTVTKYIVVVLIPEFALNEVTNGVTNGLDGR